METSIIRIFVLTAVFLACSVRASVQPEMEQKIVERILDPEKYNPSVRATLTRNSTDPTVMHVNTYIRQIDDLDDFNKEFSVQLTFRQSWKDSRLIYSSSNETKYVSITNPSKIWIPDTFFPNENSGHFHNILTPNVLIRIKPNGEVLYSTRISLKLRCPMDLTYFPLDSQICSITIASYGYTTSDLVYLWKSDDPVQLTKNLNLRHFTLDKFYTDYCTSRTNTGEYSCVKIDLQFHREFGYYFSKIYLPTIILVMMSWLCFWMDPRKTVARVFIWMALLLAFSVKVCSFSKEVPPSTEETVYEIWISTCSVFLAAVVFQTGLITLFFSGKGGNSAEDTTSEENNCSKKRDSSENPPHQQRNLVLRIYHVLFRKYPSPEQKIDFLCRILFPLAFALFNLFYWCCTVRKND